MPFEDVTDCLVGNAVTEIRQGTHDPVIAPTDILLSHSDNERFHLRIDSRPTGIASVFGSIELVRDQPAVPGQNGVGLGHTRYPGQSLAAESFADLGERGSLRIRETQTRRQLRAENAVFGGQVLVLEEQFLIDQAGHVRQQADPAILFHAVGS